MARAKKTVAAGSLSVNMTGLTFRQCDAFEIEGAFIIVTNYEGDEPIETLRLHANQTMAGIDENGAWYANMSERTEVLDGVDTVQVGASGDLIVHAGEDSFVYIPASLAGRAVITGEVETIEAETEETVNEAPAEPEPAPRRGRRTNAQIAADEAAALEAEAAAEAEAEAAAEVAARAAAEVAARAAAARRRAR